MKVVFASWNGKDDNDYPYQNWYFPLKKLSSKFVVFDPREEYFRNGKEKMNSKFISLIEKEKPDILFLTMIYDEFYISTLEKIKKISKKTKIINFFSDDEWRFDKYSKYLSLFVDVAITSYFPVFLRAKRMGLNNFYFMPYCCNTERFNKIKAEKKYDVSFIGQPTPERKRVISELTKRGIKVNLWGKNWHKEPEYEIIKENYHGMAEDIVGIINESKIILGLLMDDFDKKIQIKGRITEVAGCGTFQIMTDNLETKNILFEGKDAAYFKNISDLIEKIKYYLKNDKIRERMAENSYKKIRKNFSWDAQFIKLFKEIKKIKKIDVEIDSPLMIDSNKIDSQQSLRRILEESDKKYFMITKKGFKTKEEFSKIVSLADEKEFYICDSELYSKFGNPLMVIRTDLADYFEGMPINSYIFQKKFALNNLKKIVGFLKNEKIDLKVEDSNKIAFPIISMPLYNLQKLKKSGALFLEFEVELYSLLKNKSFLRFTSKIICILTEFLVSNNLFILNLLKQDIKRKKKW